MQRADAHASRTPVARSKSRKLDNPISEATQKLLDQPIEFIPSPAFSRATVESMSRSSLDAPVREESPHRRAKREGEMRGLSRDLVRVCATPLLTPAREQELFRQMNYFKFRAAKLQSKLKRETENHSPVDANEVSQFEAFLRKSQDYRNQIVEANTRLVVSIAKKYVSQRHSFEELFSDGMASLIRATEKFDFRRGYRFSTYATTAVKNNFHHMIKGAHRLDRRFASGVDVSFEEMPENQVSLQQSQEQLRAYAIFHKILSRLTDVKQSVLNARYSLDGDEYKPRTLREVSGELGISRERVRQLQAEAIMELRTFASAEGIEF